MFGQRVMNTDLDLRKNHYVKNRPHNKDAPLELEKSSLPSYWSTLTQRISRADYILTFLKNADGS